jgi:TonB family protein
MAFPAGFASAFAVALLTLCGCMSEEVYEQPSPQVVMNRCLTSVAMPGRTVPTEATLNSTQWRRYVGCKIGGNIFAMLKRGSEDVEATVSIRVAPDGSITSVELLNSSGNVDYDEAVKHAIKVASPLPAVPPPVRLVRLDIHFRPSRMKPVAQQS